MMHAVNDSHSAKWYEHQSGECRNIAGAGIRYAASGGAYEVTYAVREHGDAEVNYVSWFTQENGIQWWLGSSETDAPAQGETP